MVKERSSNFEILRIISMIFIIFMHCCLFGFSLYEQSFSFGKVLLDIMFAGGKIGVNCFILISGYFMIKSNISVKKIFKLVFEVMFYSLIIMIFGLIFLDSKLSLNSFLSLLFPIIHGNYWFITCYMMLYLLIPFINKIVLRMGRKFHRNIILLLIVLWSVIPTILFNAYVGFSDVGWFIVLYLLGGYIRLYYKDDKKENFLSSFIKSLSYFIICLILTIGMDFLSGRVEWFSNSSPYITSSTLTPYFVHFLNMNSLPLLLSSICLFMAFKHLQIGFNKIVNMVASTTFGIYIIHEHPFLKYYIWNEIFENRNYYIDAFHIVCSAVLSVLIVFICGMVIDICRQKFVEKPVMKLFDKYYPSLEKKGKKYKNKINKLLKGTCL